VLPVALPMGGRGADPQHGRVGRRIEAPPTRLHCRAPTFPHLPWFRSGFSYSLPMGELSRGPSLTLRMSVTYTGSWLPCQSRAHFATKEGQTSVPIAVSKQGATIESSGEKAGLTCASSPGSVLIDRPHSTCTLCPTSFRGNNRLLINDDCDSEFQAV